MTGYWCPTCGAPFAPEWRPVAGVEMAMHIYSGVEGWPVWHGLHRAEVETFGEDSATFVYEVVVRENGQYKVLEPDL